MSQHSAARPGAFFFARAKIRAWNGALSRNRRFRPRSASARNSIIIENQWRFSGLAISELHPIHPRPSPRPETEPPLFPVPDRQVRPLRTPVPKKASSGTPATTSALRPVRSALSVPRRASRWPCPASAPRKTAPQVHRLGAPPAHLSSSTTRGHCLGSEANVSYVPAQATFARRPGPPLRSASGTA